MGEEVGKSPLGHYIVNGQAPDAGNMEILREFGTERRKQGAGCFPWFAATSAVVSP